MAALPEPAGGVGVAPLFSPCPLLHFRLTLIRCGYIAVTGVKALDPIKKDHRQESSSRVNATIHQGGRPPGNETLVVFIRQREQAGDKYTAEGASSVPTFRVAGLEGVVEEQPEDCVFAAMRELPNQKMNCREGLGGKVNVQ